MKPAFQLVLHAHLPFIRHPENPVHLEESWFFEAVHETYLPLLERLDGLDAAGGRQLLTLSISAPLMAMFDDTLLRDRCRHHLVRLVELGEQEQERTAGDPAMAPLAAWYLERFTRQLALWDAVDQDLTGAFARLARRGVLELITCVGTHGFLPLMLHDASREAQIITSAEHFYERTGLRSRGMWMGECAYWWGVDAMLARAGVEYTFVDEHGITSASRPPLRGTLAPLHSPAGVAFFGRDAASSRQVWSATEGYPGDFRYREFYRDIGWDLPWETIGPWLHPDGIRLDTGFKYHRITSRQADVDKQPWVPADAMQAVEAHAEHFVQSRVHQLCDAAEHLNLDRPVVTCPYDAELFGHWWFEGPAWIEAVIRRAMHHPRIQCTTPGAWLDQGVPLQVAEPAPSSWGEHGDYSVWLNPLNADFYPILQHAEHTLRAHALVHLHQPDPWTRRVFNQAARELMLAQASDWAFIVKTNTAVPYARARTREHTDHVHQLCAWHAEGEAARGADVAALEARTPIFPYIDFRHWAADPKAAADAWGQDPPEAPPTPAL
jgi:1,4-alpha-glucan branching enzyme